jgi:ABC-type uncharacterized transport system YnjBCD substrate-binding protein
MAGGLLCSSLTMAAEKADWDKVLEQAKQEGNVTFHVWYLQSQWRIFVQEFENNTALKYVFRKADSTAMLISCWRKRAKRKADSTLSPCL